MKATIRRPNVVAALIAASLATAGSLPVATLGSAAGDPVVSLPASVVGVVEGNAGTTTVTLTASLSAPSAATVTVHYATANGSATTGDADYVAASGTLTFAPGATTAPIPVSVRGDTKLEDYQTFSVHLSSPTGAKTGNAVEKIEIRNDEKPKLAMAGAKVAEGATAHFHPKLRQRYYQPISVTAQTADKTAHAPGDYSAFNGPVTFAAGSKTGTAVDVATIADGITEPKEVFKLSLSGSSVSATKTASGTILASSGASVCNTGGAAPAQYQKVVVFSLENRSWSGVGGVGFAGMPYLHQLAASCSYFSAWTEANTSQNSATQYVSQAQGDTNHTVLNDCAPSATCNSQADNIYRQARAAGKTAINYVEGATSACSTSGNAVKHVPAMYFWGADDQSHCSEQVRPYSEFDPSNLVDYSFVTPTQCNDGHDCDNAVVDAWLQANLAPVLTSADYQAGKVLVEVWYDEGSPVPNLYLSPSAHPGPFATSGIGYASTLRLWENALGLPCLANACTAPGHPRRHRHLTRGRPPARRGEGGRDAGI